MRILLPTLLALGAMAFAFQGPDSADVVLLNGTIYTANDRMPRVEAVAVAGDRIAAVGSSTEIKKHVGPKTRVIDLKGLTALPGLTDSHYHLAGVGERELSLNLEGIGSLNEFLSHVRERVEQAKAGEWVSGRGWIETHWKPQAFPTRDDLDRISPRNPVYLTRADGHGAVVNSLALQKAGIMRDTPNPFGGEIMKDSAGEPTGMLLDRAQGLVSRLLPSEGPDHLEKALRIGAQRSLELGWTQVQIAGSSWEESQLLKQMCGDGRMKLRIYDTVRGPGSDASRLIESGPVFSAHDHRFTLRGIKVVFDGALGSRGAALLEPYNDHNTAGFLTQKAEALQPMLENALKSGIQVETHAIGDRANREILDLYEKAFDSVPPAQRKIANPRWRVEHAQIVHPDDVPRFAKLGIIPSMQPSHAIGDLHFAPSRLGIPRLERAYSWQSFLKAGCIITGGSDAPVEKGDPMIEFYAAVARKDLKGFSGNGWHPEQSVSREQALKMFTAWPAYAAFEEVHRGTIEPGKLADFTVLSSDIMRIPAAQIPKTRCVMTIVGGEMVYDSRKQSTKTQRQPRAHTTRSLAHLNQSGGLTAWPTP